MKTIHKLKRKILQSKELRSIPKLKGFDFELDKQNIPESALLHLKAKYQEYVLSTSSPEMAISYELSVLILAYCFTFRPLRVLDLGSGFSSFVLRFYQSISTSKITVYSVDDDILWLEKTKEYIANNLLDTDLVFSLGDFKKLKLDNFFDFILLDLNFVEVRKDYIDFSIKRLCTTGLLIIDDVHKIEFLREVKKIADRDKCSLFNIKKITNDQFERFAIALKK